ncbi:MAG TPA: ketopantoate reductase family protein [Methylocystis sp.]|nr:ketopantoate reductase family protein [Methylocystis sp.]
MRILVLGAGAVGGYFGGRLAGAGADVTFLVRARRAAQLAQNGLIVRSPLGDLRTPVKAVERVEQPFDLIILSCKAYDLEAAMTAVAPAVGPDTFLLPLLNGLRHFDALDAQFSARRVLGGCCFIGAALTPAGEIEHLNRLQRLVLGPRLPEQREGCERARAALAQGGFSPQLSFVVMEDVWEKLVFLASLAGITCLMRATIGAIASTSDGAAIALELLAECRAVAAASFFPPRPEFLAQSRAMLTDRASDAASSMLRDMQRGGETEQDHILGDMLLRAASLGVATPVLRLARAHMQAYDAMRAARG